MRNPANTEYAIHELLRERWSARAYSTQPIADSILLRLFEAARWAPSGSNRQPWSFVVVARDDAQNHPQLVAALGGMNPQWASAAPVLAAAVAKLNPPPDNNRYVFYNVGLAVAQLTAQATAEGLHVCQIGGFDHDKARAALNIPADHEPVVLLAIGYYGSIDDLPEELRQREQAVRVRKPLSEFVYGGQWGQPLTHMHADERLDTPALP